MKTADTESAKSRSSVTFRIRPDAERLLTLACRATGQSEAAILNEALLACGPQVIAQMQADQAKAGRELRALLESNSRAASPPAQTPAEAMEAGLMAAVSSTRREAAAPIVRTSSPAGRARARKGSPQ